MSVVDDTDAALARVKAVKEAPPGTAPESIPGNTVVDKIDRAIAAKKVQPEPYVEDLTPPGGKGIDPDEMRRRDIARSEAYRAGEPQRRKEHFENFLTDNNVRGKFAGIGDDLSQGAMYNLSKSRDFESMQTKFNEHYPEGTLMPAPGHEGGDAFLYKKDKTDDWHELDTGSLGFAGGKLATPQTAGVIAGSVASGGMGPLMGAAYTALGAYGGSLADWVLERTRGYSQKETFGEAMKTGSIDAITAGGAEFGARAAPFLPGAARQIKDLKLSDILVKDKAQGLPYVEAAEKLGVTLPGAAQVSGDPIVRGKFAQVAGTSPVAKDLVTKQNQDLRRVLESKVSQEGFEGTSPENLRRLRELEEASIEQQLMEDVPGKNVPGVDQSEATAAYKQGVAKYKVYTDVEKNRLADQVESKFKADDARFNIMPLKNSWDEIKPGIQGQGTEGKNVQISGPTSALQKIGKKVEQLSYEVQTTGEQSSYKQMSALRDEIAAAARGGNPTQRAMADRLMQGINEVLETPHGLQPETQQLLEKANAFSADVKSKLDLFEGRGAAPDILKPNNYDAVDAFRRTSPDEFNKISNAFRFKLYTDPENIEKHIGVFRSDRRTLGLVMSDAEQEAWKSYGRSIKKLNDSKLTRVIDAQSDSAQASVDMIMGLPKEQGGTGAGASPIELSQLTSKIGGKDSKTAESLRQGIWTRILDKATETSSEGGGQQALNAGKVVNEIDDLLQSGSKKRLDVVMRDEDYQTMDAVRRYAKMISDTREGGQIQSKNVISTITSPLKLVESPKHWGMAVAQVLNNQKFARILTQPISSRMFLEAAEEGPTPKGARLMAGAITSAVRGLEGGTPEKRTDQE
jgi:hypothetical protein